MKREGTQQIAVIRKAAAAVGLRLRLGRALAVLPVALGLATASIAAVLAAHQALPASITAARVVAIAAGLLVLAVGAPLVAFARPLPPRAGAAALERHHALQGRLTAALAFAESPPAGRTALMDLAIDDACAHAGRLAPRDAAPLHAPAGLLLAGALALATVTTARLQTAEPEPATLVPSPRAAPSGAVMLDSDELDALGDGLVEIEGCAARPDPEVMRFRRLLSDLRAGKLDREAALPQLRGLERSLDREDTGRGKSRRQTILAAASRGFRGAGYHDTFVAYRAVAREHLDQDRIPDGHRFYVRRYFDLIRPRL